MQSRYFILSLFFLLLVNFIGLFDTVFTGDSALYASISKSFVTSGNWLDIYVDGKDWLDKPHFPFWMSALSMQVFGINSFGYKFPSFLFFVIGLFYTYKLSLQFYSKQVAWLAVLLLASAIHIIVSNNDVRAEAVMVGLIMGSVYHLFRLSERYSFWHMLIGALYCAAAIMTKGIFILIVIFPAVLGHLLFRKEYGKLFSFRWVWCFLLVLLFILPEVLAVYLQFDRHPEKIVFGQTNVSGIKFFFWDSQFGRFFNTGPIKGKGDYFFFVHTMLWAFAPWAIIGFTSIGHSIYCIFKKRTLTEYLTFLGFIVMFVVFSISKFQLPHYTNILFPFISIITANYIYEKLPQKAVQRIFYIGQYLYIGAFIIVIALLDYFFLPGISIKAIAVFVFGLGAAAAILKFVERKPSKVFYLSLFFAGLFGIYLNVIFYPQLLKYQSASEAAFYLNKEMPHAAIATATTEKNWLLQFYAAQPVAQITTPEQATAFSGNGEAVLYIDDNFMMELKEQGMPYEVVKTFSYYHITRLKPKFINYGTRDSELEKRYLIQLSR